jgi:hypothetical protein
MVYAERFSQWILNNLRSRRIHMRGLPRGVRVLVIVGYGSVLGLLVATALIWYFWIRPSGGVPLPLGAAIAFSSLWFVVGWAFVLTGASDSRPPVFLLIFALLSLQIYILLGAIGPGKTNAAYLVPVLLLAAVVTTAHQRSYGSRYWRGMPLVEFVAWEIGLIGLLVVAWVFDTIVTGTVPFAEGFAGALLPLFVLTFLFWIVSALTTVDLGVNLARAVVLGLSRRLPEDIFRTLSVPLLLVPGLVWVVWTAAIWGGTNTHWSRFWVGMNGLITVPLTLVVGVLLLASTRRWTLRVAATLLALSITLPIILLPLALIFSETQGGRAPSNIMVTVGLLVYGLLNFGAAYVNTEGFYMPRTSRALIYLGTVILTLSMTLVFFTQCGNASNFCPLGTQSGEPSPRSVWTGLGFVFLAPVYLVWLVWKHPGRLSGDEPGASEPQPSTSLESYPPGVHMYGGWVAFILGFVGGFFVGNFTPIVLYVTFSVNWGLQITLFFAVLVLVAGTIAYFKGALSKNIVVGAVGIWVGLLGALLL